MWSRYSCDNVTGPVSRGARANSSRILSARSSSASTTLSYPIMELHSPDPQLHSRRNRERNVAGDALVLGFVRDLNLEPIVAGLEGRQRNPLADKHLGVSVQLARQRRLVERLRRQLAERLFFCSAIEQVVDVEIGLPARGQAVIVYGEDEKQRAGLRKLRVVDGLDLVASNRIGLLELLLWGQFLRKRFEAFRQDNRARHQL